MKRVILLALAALTAGVATVENAAAQARVELGVRAGITSQDLSFGNFINPDIDTELPDFEPGSNIDHFSTDTRIGFHAAIVSRIRLTAIGSGALGLGLFLQPEVVYTQNNFKIQRLDENRHPEGGVSTIRMQSVDIPLMLSLKVSIVRVQAGVVFNAVYKNTGLTKDGVRIVPIKPTMGYTAGLSVDIFGGLVLDGRYYGQFKKLQNGIEAGGTVYTSVRASLSNWSVGLAWLF